MKSIFTFPIIQTKTIATQVSKAAERAIKKGHPWVYQSSILKAKQEGNAGDLSVIFESKTNKLLAVGLFDPFSNISIKILTLKEPLRLNQEFLTNRIKSAFEKRIALFEITNAYRLVYGENDFLPGLIIDVYDEVAVVKIYSSIWIPFLEFIAHAVAEISKTKAQVLRFSRQVNALDEKHGLEEGQVIFGNLDNSKILINENDVRFEVDVVKGHKTGFFLDHRQNRILVGKLAKGKNVLDVFCYAGGFSVHALSNGANSVVSIDISKQAILSAKKNADLNDYAGTHIPIAGDAFEELNRLILASTKFDLIVIDPPSFAKSKDEIDIALKQYTRLALLASQLITKNGTIVLASCSSKITEADFMNANEKGLNKSNLNYFLKMKSNHDIDHPINMPESAYLKCCIYQISS